MQPINKCTAGLTAPLRRRSPDGELWIKRRLKPYGHVRREYLSSTVT